MKNLLSTFVFALAAASFWSSTALAQFDFSRIFGGGENARPPIPIDLPENFDEMSDDERREYFENNRPEGAPNFGSGQMPDFSNFGNGQRPDFGSGQKPPIPAGVELPENLDEMSDDERREYFENNRPEGVPNFGSGQKPDFSNFGNGQRPPEGVALPDDFESMSDDERREYFENNRPEGVEIPENAGEKKGGFFNFGRRDSSGERPKDFGKNARKGKNFKKFDGELRPKKNFSDAGEIENLDAVQFLQQRGILDGYEDGSFGPENSVNRAESLKILLEALGEAPDTSAASEFSDVPADAWFAGYVAKAKDRGIVRGYEDGSFQPGKTVNQAELLKMSFESFGIDLSDYEVSDLPDGVDENAWFAPYLQYAIDNNLVDESDIDLSGGMNREAFSELTYRLIQQQEALD